MAGVFHKMDASPSNIENLLNLVDIADNSRECRTEEEVRQAAEAGAVPPTFPSPPSIEEFLAEEDITRECRGDNKRLIAYLCRPEIVSALVDICINIQPVNTHAGATLTAAPVAGSVPPAVAAGTAASAPAHDAPHAGTADRTRAVDSPAGAAPTAAGIMEPKPTVVTSAGADAATAPPARAASPSALEEDAAREEENLRKARYTRSYIASELLSADVRPLADAVVGNDVIIDSLFSCLDRAPPGELDTYVGIHFAKIISSLLKTRNEETLAQLSRRGGTFIPGLLKHLALPSIADLIVRILDGPDVDRGYSTVISRPSPAALNLLVAEDVLNGLADRFVAAARPDPATNARAESTSARRIREETMYHASISIQGIVTRILQLPALGVHIPAMLNAYATPSVIMRMLIAGLDAYDAGCASSSATERASPMAGPALDPAAGGIQSSTSGSMAALLHALKLAAILMTTEANVVRDDNPSDGMDGGPGNALGSGIHVVGRHAMLGIGRGRSGMGYGMGRGAIGGGIAASIQRQHEEQERLARAAADAERDPGGANGNETEGAAPEPPVLPDVGCPIESTAYLEAELLTLFDRLSQMFGSDTTDEAEGRPLGSLRLTLAEFFVACMKKASERTVAAIVELGVPKKLTVLFLRYEWSSMLHGVITRSIVSAFSGESSGLPARKAWLNAGLVTWLTKAWALNEAKADAEEFRFRAGYMGHLIQIGHNLLQYTREFPEESTQDGMLSEDELKILQQFAEQHLAPAHKIESTPLGGDGGQGPNTAASDGDDVYDVTNELPDMSDVMDALTQGDDQNAAISRFTKYLIHRTEDDEEVVPLDVEYSEGDLSHFGPDDDDDGEVAAVSHPTGGDVDHDLPANMRSKAESSSDTHARYASGGEKSVIGNASTEQDRLTPMSELRNVTSSGAGSKVQPRQGAKGLRSGYGEDNANTVDVASPTRLASADDFDDSSDDDKGTYQDFVECATGLEDVRDPGGAQKDPMTDEKALNLESSLPSSSPARGTASTRVHGGEPRRMASGNDVMELEEADPVAARQAKQRHVERSGSATSATAGGVVIPEDDEDDSSEDDGEGWTTFSEFADKKTHLKVEGDDQSRAK